MSTKLEQNLSNEDLTTDAMPSPPRSTKKPTTEKQYSDRDNYKNENSDTNNFAYKKSKRPGFTKPRVPQQAYIVNVCNSTNVNVTGSKNYYGCPKEDEEVTSPRRKSDIIETKAVQLLFTNKSPVTWDDIRFVSTHMGQGWRDTFRLLDYSDGEIDQCEEKFRLSIKEVIYQLLRDWKEHKADEATVALLSKTLWETNQKDAVSRWSNKTSVI